MEKKLILEKFQQLMIEWNQTYNGGDILEQMEILLEDYIKQHPLDCEILVKLAFVEYMVPFADYPKALYFLERVLACNPNDSKILLAVAYIQWADSLIRSMILRRLQALRTNNNQEQALHWYAQSLYYSTCNDVKGCVKALNHSVDLYSDFVWPHVDLGRFYKSAGDSKHAKSHFKSALANVQHVYKEQEFLDFTNIDAFIDEHLKGTVLSKMNFERIQNYIVACN